ncbi:MAG: electron transfer flavoprotein subunit beta, partial [Tissierellia bacterium]|nr:electron transfer flavoprotein subunit beta [Tissierellia bacterium]
QIPCVLTCVKELNQPRYMTIKGIMEAFKKDIITWDHKDLNLDPQDCGLSASPTQVERSFTPAQKGKGEVFKGNISEIANQLVNKLTQEHLI